MLIPFPLLRKLEIDSRQKWILAGLFCLPIIPIIFAIVRLVKTSTTTHNVDPIQFQLYSMLENTSAIISSCLPSIRLFVSTRTTTLASSSRSYSHGLRSSLNDHDRNPLDGTPKGAISLKTVVHARNGHIIEERGTVGGFSSRDNEEHNWSPAGRRGV